MRDKNKLNERIEYVKKTIQKENNTTKTVKKLAKQLFLSERTIYNDLAK